MEDSLESNFQSEEIGIHINTRTKKYYSDDSGAQTITFSDGTLIPILYDGVLSYILVRRSAIKDTE